MKRSTKNIILVCVIAAALAAMILTVKSVQPTNTMDNTMATQTQQPPELPSDSGDGSTTLPDQATDSGAQTMTPPQMPSGQMPQAPEAMGPSAVSTGTYVVLAIEGLVLSGSLAYLLLSDFNQKDIRATFSSTGEKIGYGVIVVLVTLGLTLGSAALANSPGGGLGRIPGQQEMTGSGTSISVDGQ